MTGEFAIAVHAIVYLNHRAETLSSEALAENVCTNPARVRKVMARLKKAGLVSTREGSVGGYRFARKPEDVTLLAILDALDMSVVHAGWKSGDPNMECLVASGMAGVMDDVCADMERGCRETLAGISIADIDARIFGKTKES